MADLSGFSLEDLQAMQSGDLSKVSTAGLRALQGMAAPAPQRPAIDRTSPEYKMRELQDRAEMEKLADPAAGMSALERGLVGAGGAVRKNYLALRSLIPGQGLTDDEKGEMAEYAKSKENLGTAGTVGDIGAEAVMALAPGGLATKGLRAGTAMLPLARAALVRGAGELGAGAAYGAATSLPDDRAQGAAFGALGSGLGMGISRLAGGLVKPLVRDEAKALTAEGIQPTIGQALGGGWNTVEQKAMSIPFVGDVIGGARQRALNEFNQAAIGKAAPGVPGMGDEAVAAARDAISDQYKAALGRMPSTFKVESTPIIASAIKAADDPALALSEGSQRRLLDYVEKNLLRRNEDITPEVAKRIESDLGAAVRRFGSSSDGEDRALGNALRQVHGEWRDSLTAIGDMAGNDAGQALRQADAAYRAFLPVDKAAASRAAQGAEEAAGQFTPKMLRKAIEATDTSANNRATRFMQPGTPQAATPFGQLNMLARNADRTLSGTVPDSGTAGRLGQGMALGAGGVAAMLNPLLIAKAGLGYLGTKAAYSRGGQKFLMEGANIEPLLNALRQHGVSEPVIRQMSTNSPEYLLAALRGISAQ
jgi:hypothetical protein